ncbi:vWA domain-containing protein [Arsenicicoccus dermatophilus]|uniref:vWA domain-containing protein n=1 Tax=Arsenicicoccus dermatophilus TaxID=1076331 RepID=UPI001F4C5CF5|nr:VWA domain-containing protein [Arsenicicoccus dermatophilus]MCH8612280.1 VWA domain-containing protein [Arsenicicoccus dermatophilus]
MARPNSPARLSLAAFVASVALAGCGDASRTTTSASSVTASSVVPAATVTVTSTTAPRPTVTVTRTEDAPPAPVAETTRTVVTERVGTVAAAGVAPAGDVKGGRMLLILDSSGSMAARDAAGRSRMEGAQAALRSVIDGLPDDAQVGLRVYGSRVRVSGKAAPGSPACTDSRLVVPVGRLDRRAMKDQIARFAPYGDTPIGYTLEQVVGDLGRSGQRSVVLVSDGEESCSGDPCAVAKRLSTEGIAMNVHTVGLEVGEAAKRQLQCIAEATGGSYHDATSQDLTRTINETVTTARGTGRTWGTSSTHRGPEPGALGATIVIVFLLWLLTRSKS